MRQTDFPSEKLGYDGDPQRQYEEDVADSNLMAGGKLISESAYLIDVKAKRKHHSSYAERYHCDKSNPSSIENDISVPPACN
jgi:hypothetical protein